jgi:hypothetical protein
MVSGGKQAYAGVISPHNFPSSSGNNPRYQSIPLERWTSQKMNLLACGKGKPRVLGKPALQPTRPGLLRSDA